MIAESMDLRVNIPKIDRGQVFIHYEGHVGTQVKLNRAEFSLMRSWLPAIRMIFTDGMVEEIADLLKVFHQRLPVKQVSADE